jgi:hypothetical protein
MIASQVQMIGIQLQPEAAGCPVRLRAKQGAGGETLAVRNGRPKGAAQLLHLFVTNPDSRQIVGANVVVSGLAAKGRFVQTLSLSNQADASDAMRSLDVSFSAEPGKDVSTDLWVPGMTAVQAIELRTITYADGSTWKLASGNTCRTVPDGTMLIGSR